MNYKHAYHAGNFADVFKHLVLIALIQSLQRKESPFCYLETHAGSGSYDLASAAAQTSKEYETGVSKIISAKKPPPLVKDYLNCIASLNPSHLKIYPGSPYFAHYFLRPQDRMILSELHEEEYRHLKKLFRNEKQVAVHHQEGYQSLKALLPFKERRGLILMDSPFENSDEFSILAKHITSAIKQFETGVFAIWYPIKARPPIERFHQTMTSSTSRPILIAELCIYPENLPTHFNGSGMLIINPPWQLDQELQSLLPWLLDQLNIESGHWSSGVMPAEAGIQKRRPAT